MSRMTGHSWSRDPPPLSFTFTLSLLESFIIPHYMHDLLLEMDPLLLELRLLFLELLDGMLQLLILLCELDLLLYKLVSLPL